MHLDEIWKTCAESSSEDWHYISGLQRREGEQPGRAIYKPDVLLAIEWGLENGPFDEPWATEPFADQRATSQFLDLIYAGAIVDRQMYVHVDGRVSMPLPKAHGTVPNRADHGYTITLEQFAFYSVLNAIEHGFDLSDYVKQAGIKIFQRPSD